jgi:octaprenyl-diphosphate synthase
MMVEADDMRVMRVLADATNTIAAGEVMQLMGSHDPQVDEARYLEVIRRKTAKLFEASARLGGVLARSAPQLEEGLAAYGAHVGTAFQLIDDVLDYSGDAPTIGKSLGDDLAEGKPTLPLIHVLRTGSPAQAALVRRAIVEGGRDDFAAVLDAIRACGSLEYARAAARSEAQAAAQAIGALPESAYKDSLLELASFSVTRRS